MRNPVLNDLGRSLPDFQPQTILDVGANTGQSAAEFATRFPSATIISFEPIRAAFELLEANSAKYSRVTCVNMALGATSGTATMRSAGTSTANRIVGNTVLAADMAEEVPIETGDAFCAARNIRKVDFLKIDAEGHDFEVLKGFTQMLCRSDIGMLQFECSLNRDNNKHVMFEEVKSFLEGLGYRLFGIFGQKRHRRNPAVVLFGDAVFVSPAAARSLVARAA